ncbi:MAG: ATP-dependent DNA helicase RecG [Acidimicrobiales bacterium]
MTNGSDSGGSRPGQSLVELALKPVELVKKIGPKRAESLKALGIESVTDLLMHYPRRLIDRTKQTEIAEMQVGEQSYVLAVVTAERSRRIRGGRVIVELDVTDHTGLLHVVFFNQPWRAKQLASGTEALFFGKVDTYRGKRQLTNPIVDLIGNRTGRIVPIYPSSDASGIAGWEFGEWVEEALRRARPIHDPVPERYLTEHNLIGRHDALSGIHHPESFAQRDEAKRRLAFDELLRLQLEVVMRRHAAERDAIGIRHKLGDDSTSDAVDLVSQFLSNLGFELTKAQHRAISEIEEDLAGPLPMNRLLQGDVGAGKTVVALAAILIAVQGGFQGAFMAPTEVLAEQHHMSLRLMLEGLEKPDPAVLGGNRPVTVALLTNRTTAAERARIRAGLGDGSVDIVVGTHALLTDDVRFASLGVAVVDEQHRFGVEQRSALRSKGRDATTGKGYDPDVLVMTATPIPRSAAMVVFGDLDMTLLDELPGGRKPVKTAWSKTDSADDAVWKKVTEQAQEGRRVFVVCPLVDGSERVQARSATEEMERLSGTVLKGLRVGLLHGQMKASEKEPVMAAFRKGDIQVLVSTTVIEVGVDVPEATVMVVEDADRFGIAQLHQLRGRVGRSDLPSWCYLLSRNDSPEASARLGALVASNDGFELAEVDLEIRGEGTILGARQKGRSDLKLATLKAEDRKLVSEARQVAEELLGADPDLELHAELLEELRLFLGDEAAFLQKG